MSVRDAQGVGLVMLSAAVSCRYHHQGQYRPQGEFDGEARVPGPLVIVVVSPRRLTVAARVPFVPAQASVNAYAAV